MDSDSKWLAVAAPFSLFAQSSACATESVSLVNVPADKLRCSCIKWYCRDKALKMNWNIMFRPSASVAVLGSNDKSTLEAAKFFTFSLTWRTSSSTKWIARCSGLSGASMVGPPRTLKLGRSASSDADPGVTPAAPSRGVTSDLLPPITLSSTTSESTASMTLSVAILEVGRSEEASEAIIDFLLPLPFEVGLPPGLLSSALPRLEFDCRISFSLCRLSHAGLRNSMTG
mmetsp:Transcript_8570/g.19085  ORF Transcript_8570/g.19085 Transcript_8570/m.19085 type:complete len:229 (+) Transcript_8570:1737-2423(+)